LKDDACNVIDPEVQDVEKGAELGRILVEA
jgi:hypothetical protein